MEEAGAAQGPTCVERLNAVKSTAIAQLIAISVHPGFHA
jgi:hypothetical protein